MREKSETKQKLDQETEDLKENREENLKNEKGLKEMKKNERECRADI